MLLRATKWYFFFSLSPFAGSGKNDCCHSVEQGHTKGLHRFLSKRGGSDLLERDTETDNLKTTAIWKEQIIPRERYRCILERRAEEDAFLRRTITCILIFRNSKNWHKLVNFAISNRSVWIFGVRRSVPPSWRKSRARTRNRNGSCAVTSSPVATVTAKM